MSSHAPPKLDTAHLVCPFSHDWLEDPIALPCGHIISQAPLVEWISRSSTCPVCREDLSDFDAANAKRLSAIAALVDQARAAGVPLPGEGGYSSAPPGVTPKWKATITKLVNRNVHLPTSIGKLEIVNTNQAFQFQTGLIAVADRSGSMGGEPISQVQMSLNSMVDRTYSNSHLATTLIGYSNDARSTEVDTSLPVVVHRQWIQDLSRNMGGTSFRCAFEAIVRVCTQMNANPRISSLEIVFLTDGEDTSGVNRVQLVKELKDALVKTWQRPYTVHVIGFGASHDAEFLQNLRKIGSAGEGAYRYADPSLNNVDILSAKISSIVDVVSTASAIPLELVPVAGDVSTVPILSGTRGSYWVDLTGFDVDGPPPSFALRVDGGVPMIVEAEIVELDDDSKLWAKWWSLQIDQIADQMRIISEKFVPVAASAPVAASSQDASGKFDVKSLDHQLCCELLRDRCEALLVCVEPESSDAMRVQQLLEWVPNLQAGLPIDSMKLNDLRFEGQFATKLNNRAQVLPTAKSGYKAMDALIPPQSHIHRSTRDWSTFQWENYVKTCEPATVETIVPFNDLAVGHAYRLRLSCQSDADPSASVATDGPKSWVVIPPTQVRFDKSDSSIASAVNSATASQQITVLSVAPVKDGVVVHFYPPSCMDVGTGEIRVTDLATNEVTVVHSFRVLACKADSLAFGLIAHRPRLEVMAWVAAHPDDWSTVRDGNGSNMLMVACSIKRGWLAEMLLAHNDTRRAAGGSCLDLDALNLRGHNVMDLAVLSGCWYTYDLLKTRGLTTTIDGQLLLRTCLERAYWQSDKMKTKGLLPVAGKSKYLTTASRLLRDKIARVTDTLINDVPSYNVQAASWLSVNGQKQIDLDKAIELGMYDVVDEQTTQMVSSSSFAANDDATSSSSFNTTNTNSSSSSSSVVPTHHSWGKCFGIFEKGSSDHVRIVELMLQRGCADANEIIPIKVNVVVDNKVDRTQFESEISWPLFAAAEKGRLGLVQILLKYMRKDDVNRVNLKKTSALWIAACNNHVDVVMALLEAGADPNLTNIGGSTALIPCCKKGQDTVVQLLLDYGLDVTVYNPERDHPILQCCRDGQATVLETLINHIERLASAASISSAAKTMPSVAHWFALANVIDGFVPLQAAAELNQIECLRVLVKYGVNLEARTDVDNQIIAGATSVHIACFNGHIRSVMVLQELGADMAALTTVLGHSLMHIAVMKRNSAMIRYLRSLDSGLLEKMNVKDIDGRLPSYYAHLEGNEALRDEFFTDRLSNLLERMVMSEPDLARKCSQVMLNYGRTIGCFEFDKITNRVIGLEGTPLLSRALLCGNRSVLDALLKMGADPLQPDEAGRSPLFWFKALGVDFGNSAVAVGALVPDCVQTMLQRVARVTNASGQNKMLLNMNRGPPTLKSVSAPSSAVSSSTSQPAFSILARMSDGFTDGVTSVVVSDIRKQASSKDLSLLGWLEKLKNAQVFPDGREVMEQLVWNAKVHVVGLIAVSPVAEDVAALSSASSEHGASSVITTSVSSSTRLSVSCPLGPIHYFALYMYTVSTTIFQQVNNCLNKWQLDQASVWQPFVACLHQAVSLLPEYDGECFRGVDVLFDADQFQIGRKLEWNGFALSSLQWNTCSELLTKKRGVIFIIKSKRCRIIAPYAANPVDGQVLSLPGAEFVVTNHYEASPLALGQVNIRQKTYKATSDLYEKIAKGKSCILVELTEQ